MADSGLVVIEDGTQYWGAATGTPCKAGFFWSVIIH